ncbi:MAG: Uma2 family endonuclease [Bacteroidetes bacterium]|nr:Uma2 family endonuclease [Bacteroidota bacterium]
MLKAIDNRPPKNTMEVFKMLPEGTRCELINGTIYLSPAPTIYHQDVILTLGSELHRYVKTKKLGKVCISPIDVYLDNRKNAFQPDLLFVASENENIIREDGIYGTPDLIIEILSPGTKTFDLTKKKKVYEKTGVKEYWVIDPQTKISIGFQLVEKKFQEFKKDKNKIVSLLLRHTFKF